MKIIDDNPKSWGRKINFVDRNNVLVGFDYESSCCESFGYVLSRSIPALKPCDPIPESLPDSECDPYAFDRGFMQSDAIPCGDGGGSVTFRLTADGLPDLFLTLYNHHNSYYSHGFEMRDGENKIHDGSI